MSRRGGAQAKTVAMYARLDDWAQQWTSLEELACRLGDQYGRAYVYATRVVRAWADSRGAAVKRTLVAQMPFYCLRPGAALDADVLAQQYWGRLPERFRKDHQDMLTMPLDERMLGVLTAYGYLRLGRSDCLTAFNNWAQAHKLRRIQKTLCFEKTSE